MSRPSFRFLPVTAYGAMVIGGVAVFLLVRRYGETMAMPAAAAVPASLRVPALVAPNALLHVLLALSAVIVVGGILGRLLQVVGQPPIIGEILAGIVLGPSLLGRVLPEVFVRILPP